MASDNRYERNIQGIADTFKASLARIQPHIRGGDRPAFTERVSARDLRDPSVAQQIADDFQQRGLGDLAELVRQRARGAQPTEPVDLEHPLVDPGYG